VSVAEHSKRDPRVLNLVEALSKRGSINIEKGKAYYQQAESLLLQASELTKIEIEPGRII